MIQIQAKLRPNAPRDEFFCTGRAHVTSSARSMLSAQATGRIDYDILGNYNRKQWNLGNAVQGVTYQCSWRASLSPGSGLSYVVRRK